MKLHTFFALATFCITTTYQTNIGRLTNTDALTRKTGAKRRKPGNVGLTPENDAIALKQKKPKGNVFTRLNDDANRRIQEKIAIYGNPRENAQKNREIKPTRNTILNTDPKGIPTITTQQLAEQKKIETKIQEIENADKLRITPPRQPRIRKIEAPVEIPPLALRPTPKHISTLPLPLSINHTPHSAQSVIKTSKNTSKKSSARNVLASGVLLTAATTIIAKSCSSSDSLIYG